MINIDDIEDLEALMDLCLEKGCAMIEINGIKMVFDSGHSVAFDDDEDEAPASNTTPAKAQPFKTGYPADLFADGEIPGFE